MNNVKCIEFTSLGEEVLLDFNNCLVANVEEIEFCIYKLDSDDVEDMDSLINELFRAIHSLKGNCRMVLLYPFVYLTHEMEEVIAEMRDGKREYHYLYGSIIISVITIVEKLIKQLIETEVCRGDILDNLDRLIKKIRDAELTPEKEDLAIAEQVLSELVKLQECPMVEPPPGNLSTEAVRESIPQINELLARDEVDDIDQIKKDNLAFFYDLSTQLDGLGVYRREQIDGVLMLCLAINSKLENPIDIQQLTAAVYIHDVGMAFIPASLLERQENLNEEDLSLYRAHVSTSTNLLLNTRGWREAAVIVSQHHERYDGSGYPIGLKGDQIHAGASILALADAFCSIIKERNRRSYKRTLFSAVALINSESGIEFSPSFVDKFNESFRELYVNTLKPLV